MIDSIVVVCDYCSRSLCNENPEKTVQSEYYYCRTFNNGGVFFVVFFLFEIALRRIRVYCEIAEKLQLYCGRDDRDYRRVRRETLKNSPVTSVTRDKTAVNSFDSIVFFYF